MVFGIGQGLRDAAGGRKQTLAGALAYIRKELGVPDTQCPIALT